MDIVRMILSQARQPAGWFGRFGARRMNRGHARLARWGLSHVSVSSDSVILDVGCGGGGTVRRLAEMAADGRVYGIDFSQASVDASIQTNQALIDVGRVEIGHGSVSSLPYAGETFNLVTAVQTHFFWPDLVADLQEVRRVLRAGGTVAIMSATLRIEKRVKAENRWSDLVRIEYHNAQKMREMLSAAGYTEISAHEKPENGWLCLLAKSPG